MKLMPKMKSPDTTEGNLIYFQQPAFKKLRCLLIHMAHGYLIHTIDQGAPGEWGLRDPRKSGVLSHSEYRFKSLS